VCSKNLFATRAGEANRDPKKIKGGGAGRKKKNGKKDIEDLSLKKVSNGRESRSH